MSLRALTTVAMAGLVLLLSSCKAAPIDGIWQSKDSNVEAYFGDMISVAKDSSGGYSVSQVSVAPDGAPYLAEGEQPTTIAAKSGGWGISLNAAAASNDILLKRKGDTLELRQTIVLLGQKNSLVKTYTTRADLKIEDIKVPDLAGFWAISVIDADYSAYFPLAPEEQIVGKYGVNITGSSGKYQAHLLTNVGKESSGQISGYARPEVLSVKREDVSSSYRVVGYCFIQSPYSGDLYIDHVYPNSLEGTLSFRKGSGALPGVLTVDAQGNQVVSAPRYKYNLPYGKLQGFSVSMRR